MNKEEKDILYEKKIQETVQKEFYNFLAKSSYMKLIQKLLEKEIEKMCSNINSLNDLFELSRTQYHRHDGKSLQEIVLNKIDLVLRNKLKEIIEKENFNKQTIIELLKEK